MCRFRVPVVLLALALLAGACANADPPVDAESRGVEGVLPPDAADVIQQEPYRHAQWSWYVADLETGDVLSSNNADLHVLTGSTAKLFTVGTAYELLGVDTTLTTSVYALGDHADGTLVGDLVLVGAGDFVLGSRGAVDGRVDYGEPGDHVYAYASPLVKLVDDDPLAGLDGLAVDIASSGITNVDGDVLVDDRLWEPFTTKEGVVTSAVVNDNLLDITVSAAASAGQPAVLAARPETAYFEVVNHVETTADGDTTLVAEEGDENQVVVSGTIPVGADPAISAYFAPDPSAYTRALFMEALERAGITVTVEVGSAPGELPAEDSYRGGDLVASLESPTLTRLGDLILNTSHNRGAETFLCLLAARAGSTECTDGLAPIREVIAQAGIGDSAVFSVDGEGSDPNATTPRAMVQLLAWAADQGWGETYRSGLPILGERGSLIEVGRDSPARGKVQAKSGTSAGVEPDTGRTYLSTKSEAGYIDAASGRTLVFSIFVTGPVFASVAEGITVPGDDIGEVLAVFQQEF